jgi:multisubunit Na+/H+ antiporter MnhB subunit
MVGMVGMAGMASMASMTDALNLGLVVLVLALAVWTIVARESFAAVAGFIVYGLLLTLIWVQLSAIDVALTEAAIGAGLTGALLVGAVSRLRKTEAAARTERPGALTRVLAAVAAIGVTAALAVCVLALPEPAPTLAPEVAANISATGVGNPITAVLLAFRAMDTLLEAIVLLFALIGVWSLGPDRAWGGRPGPLHRADPNGALAYAARVLPPIGIVVAIYILWAGADEPGGKFQGATMLAAMWLLVMMAGLFDAPAISRRWLRIGLVAGPAVFIAIGLVGAVAAGAFLAYPEGYAKPLIIVIEVALMPSLALTLTLLLVGAPERWLRP